MGNQLKQAKEYHDRHINVVPLRLPDEEYESKGKKITARGKEPKIRFVKDYHYGERPQTAYEINDLFGKRFPNCNIGAVAGFGSGNLLGLDHDNVDKFIDLHRKNDTYRNICDNTLSSRTRRGRHFFVRTDVPARCGQNTKYKIDFKGQNGIIVMPESIWKHEQQTGKYLFDQWEEILQVPIADLAFLGVKPALEIEYAGGTYGLGDRLFTVFDGNRLHYASKSNAEQAVIVKFVATGYPFDAIEEIFKRHSSSITHYAQHDNPDSYLLHSYQKACQYHRENQRDFDIQVAEAMQTVMSMTSFPTPATRDVMIHILQIARECGHLEPTLPVRTLAERSNKCFKTVANALTRLTESNHIEKIQDEHYGQAASYRVNLDTICPSVHTSSQWGGALMCVPMGTSPEFTLSKDVFTHFGIGSTGYRVVEYLNRNVGRKLKLNEIVKGSDVSRSTVQRKLEALDRFLEILKVGKTCVYTIKHEITDLDLEKIAIRKGVKGRKESLKRKHESERKGYRSYLENKRPEWTEQSNETVPKNEREQTEREQFTECLKRLREIKN